MRNQMFKRGAVVLGFVATMGLLGCGDNTRRNDTADTRVGADAHHDGHRDAHDGAMAGADSASVGDHARMFQGLSEAVAVLQPTAGNAVKGTVTFEDQGDSLRVTTDISGLPADREFGFHIHQWGDASSSDGTSAGDHYNPESHQHALPPTEPRHAGDLGNLRSDASGAARTTITVGDLSVAGTMNPILGRSVVVHEKPDDGSQPSGNAGARLAVGVIGVAQAAGTGASSDTTRTTGRTGAS